MSETDFLNFLTLIKNIPDIDAEYSIRNIGGSVHLYVRILKKVVHMLISNIELMDQYINAGDLRAFGIKVHGMKGSFNQIGCFYNARLAEALEMAAKRGDVVYCNTNYTDFRKKVLCFYEQANAALFTIGMGIDVKPKDMPKGSLPDFLDSLAKAKAAATGFESIQAINYISPLAKYHFDANIDLLISRTLEELEAFHPRKALPYITELINECDKLS